MRMFSIIFLSSLIILLCAMLYFSPGTLLTPIANFLIVDEKPQTADAVVVLNNGMGIYERLIEAADLYDKGFVDQIIIFVSESNQLLEEVYCRHHSDIFTGNNVLFTGSCNLYSLTVRETCFHVF